MNEFDLIDSLIQQFGDLTRADFITTGPGDDAAVLSVGNGQQLVVSTDTLVPNVHFPVAIRPDLLGYRAVAVNVSDLAAMGAEPLGMTIALTIDSADKVWMSEFAKGVSVAAREFGLKILGGNLARGPLNVSVTIQGAVPEGKALLRSGAEVGDDIWLTGFLGATHAYLEDPTLPAEPLGELLEQRDRDARVRYFLPQPRVAFASKIREVVHAAIDVSDGLMAEVGHIGKASTCGALVYLDRAPVWPGLDTLGVVGSDDSYELLYTAHSDARDKILEMANETHTSVIVIGEIVDGSDVALMKDGDRLALPAGYQHFAS